MNKISKLVVSRLKSKKINLSVAESCTGGMLAQNITSVSGASKVFAFGIITYSNQSKIKYLNVPREIIKKYGAVSEECCYSMLVNLEKISKSNLYVVITGVAGPNGGTKIKPVGLVYIGIKIGNKIIIKENLFKNKNRIAIQKATVNTSLNTIDKII